MSWKAGLVTRLLADSDIAALVGDRVEWDDLAPDSALPAITLQTISDPRPQTHDGFDDFRDTRVQVNCLARTATEAGALLELVIPALIPPAFVAGTTFLRSFVDGGGSDAIQTPTGRRCRERTDLIIWHN